MIINSRILRLAVPGMPKGCFLVTSFSMNKDRNIEPNITFHYDGGEGISVEWEPRYGPIAILYSCEKSDPEAIKHWYYPFIKKGCYWSQLAVEESGIKEMARDGDFAGIFRVLKEWCK